MNSEKPPGPEKINLEKNMPEKTIFERTFAIAVLLTVLLLLNQSCRTSEQDPEASRANIILILADDLGYGDLSCYGQKVLSTPNLDRMASEGILFTRHYCGSTVCAPSRASLLTGKHSGHATVRGNYPGQQLAGEEITVAEILKQAGYVTAAIGKWGVGNPPPPDDPERNGFDFFYGYINMFHAHNYYPEFMYRNGKKEYLEGNRLYTVNGDNPWRQEGAGVAELKGQYAHDLFDREALRFIGENSDTTFFLYLAYNIPHTNNEAGKFLGDGMEVPGYGPFKDRDWPQPEKGFAEMIRRLDNSVGTIMDTLSVLGIDENTLVIFISDNGPHEEGGHRAEFFDSNGKLRGIKRDLYEGGIRTPFIARWPEHIKPGTTSGHISAFWDILPTFSEIAGINPPGDTDGISFLDALTGREDLQHDHEYLYWEFYEKGGKQALLRGNWKAVRLDVFTDNPRPTELFDLRADITEKTNVAAGHPGIVEEMELLMKEAHSTMPGFSIYPSDQ
jgi:arylsulfatase A-like enzyme